MTGMVGNAWALPEFTPMGSIPTACNLTTYAGGNEDVMATPLSELAQQIEAGKLRLQIGRVYHIDEIVEAHKTMDNNTGNGKIVVLT